MDRDYLFLNNRGCPYYQSIQDYEMNPGADGTDGVAIGQYIRERVTPELQPAFKYRFHDLRATFSMNLMDHLEVLIDNGVIKPGQAREYLKVRLGHSDSRSADNYLKFRRISKIIKNLQDDYESRLISLATSLVAQNVQF